MMSESRLNQTTRMPRWSTTRFKTKADLIVPKESIVMCTCNAEVTADARFCPHCGTALTPQMSLSTTTPMSVPTTRVLSPSKGSQKDKRRLLSEVTTVKEADWIPPLPPKYTSSLQLGTAPELVIWEMFKRVIELRTLLEETVTCLPPGFSNPQTKRAESFLRSHCVACGDRISQGEDRNTPICEQCQNMGGIPS